MAMLNPLFSTENVTYRDGKRYVWLMSLLVPAALGCGPLLYWLTGSVAAMWIPAAVVYVAIPLLDVVLGEDLNNPPEEVVPLTQGLPPLWGEMNPARVALRLSHHQRVHYLEPERRHQSDQEHPKVSIRQRGQHVEVTQRLVPPSGIGVVVRVSHRKHAGWS